ncbi:hypothetical protein Godav_019429, partial [Gossypium davidsonii]|nr:hypothetical protein [Gossypium davidsonii]MBA0642024.1 hypothetical protein [Gossypium klotzschianum]
MTSIFIGCYCGFWRGFLDPNPWLCPLFPFLSQSKRR